MLDEKGGWDGVSRLRTPALDEVRRDLAAWPLAASIVAAERLEGGLRNRNIALSLNAPPYRAVLRYYDADPAAWAKEAALLAHVRGALPVPEVLHAAPGAEDGMPPRLVLSFVEGVPLRELVLRGDARAVAESARAAGVVLARIGQFGFAQAGFLRDDLSVDPGFGGLPSSYPELIAYFLEGATAIDRVDAPLARRIAAHAAMWGTRFFESIHIPTLVHNDFNSRNLLVREQHGAWTVSAILDWEFAMSGSFLGDVGNMLRYERPDRARFEPAFSAGCRERGLDLPPEWLARARAFDLVALLEFLGRPGLPENIVAEVRELVASTVGAP